MGDVTIAVSYRILRHPKIAGDIDGIFDFLADFAGVDIAEVKISQVNQRIEALSNFPELGTIRNDIHPRLRVLTAAGKAVICFIVDAQKRKFLWSTSVMLGLIGWRASRVG